MKILPNGIAVLEEDSHLSRWIEQQGRLCIEGAVSDLITPMIPKGGYVIDAGASLGDHTIAYAEKVGHKGRVFAFEPNPKAFECLVHNMRERSWVACFNAPLSSSRSGYTYTENLNAGAGFVGHGATGKSMLIDDLDLSRCDYIHLDVEGYELFALHGGIKTICRFRPILVLEINRGCLERCGLMATDLFRFLDATSYSWQKLTEACHPDQYDIVCRPF